MKKLLLFIFITIFYFNVFAVSPQKRYFDDLLVESGTSTKDIMPLLTKIAEQQQIYFKHKGYFRRIYGQYRGNRILIKIYSNGKVNSAEELEVVVDQILHNIITRYPSSEGRLEVIPFSSDPWDLMVVEFKNGKVVSKKMLPSKEEINERAQLRSLQPKNVIKEKIVFDLEKGALNGLKIGISMKPEDVIRLMGKQPEDARLDIFSYYKDGLEFSFLKRSGYSYCYAITVFLQDYDAIVARYKAFKGEVNPLNKRESQEKILEKFKRYKNFTVEDMDTETLTYKTPYGSLRFFFNKNNGVVDTIELRSK